MHHGTQLAKPLTLTVQNTEKALNLGHTKIYELIKSGRLKSTKVDGRTLIVYSSIERLLGGAP